MATISDSAALDLPEMERRDERGKCSQSLGRFLCTQGGYQVFTKLSKVDCCCFPLLDWRRMSYELLCWNCVSQSDEATHSGSSHPQAVPSLPGSHTRTQNAPTRPPPLRGFLLWALRFFGFAP